MPLHRVERKGTKDCGGCVEFHEDDTGIVNKCKTQIHLWLETDQRAASWVPGLIC